MFWPPPSTRDSRTRLHRSMRVCHWCSLSPRFLGSLGSRSSSRCCRPPFGIWLGCSGEWYLRCIKEYRHHLRIFSPRDCCGKVDSQTFRIGRSLRWIVAFGTGFCKRRRGWRRGRPLQSRISPSIFTQLYPYSPKYTQMVPSLFWY